MASLGIVTRRYSSLDRKVDAMGATRRYDVTAQYGPLLESDDVWKIVSFVNIDGTYTGLVRGYVARVKGQTHYTIHERNATAEPIVEPISVADTKDDVLTGTRTIITKGSPDAAARWFGKLDIETKRQSEAPIAVHAQDEVDQTAIVNRTVASHSAEERIGKNARKKLARAAAAAAIAATAKSNAA